MAKIVYASAIVVIALCLLNGGAHAQQLTCSDAMAMATVNASELYGIWYAVARNPSSPYGCVQVDLTGNNETLQIATTFSNTPNAWYQNQTVMATISLADAGNNNGAVNVTYNPPIISPAFLKLLTTDYNNYAIACGYTNATDNSTSFGVVLSRTRMPTNVTLQGWESMAAQNYSNFNTNMPLIPQSELCYTNGARTLSVMTSLIALLYTFLKFMN